jgi:hypothetical protein
MGEQVALGRLGAGDSQAPILPQVLPPGAVPADVAIGQIADLYRVLQAQASRIDRVYGAAIPCDVQVAHNNAVRAYQTAAQSVFNQILAQNPSYKIVQYVYDSSGTLMATVTKPRPVMPTVYSIPGCLDNAPMAGAFAGTLGALPALAWIAIVFVLGVTAVTLTAVVIKNWPGAAIETAKAEIIHVQTQLDCVDRVMSTGKVSRAEATKTCKGIGSEAPQASAGFISTFLIVIGVTAVGYLVYRAVKKGGGEGPSDAIDGAGFAGSRRETGNRMYKGRLITKLHPSGYYEIYTGERFLKFDSLSDVKQWIDESNRMSRRR